MRTPRNTSGWSGARGALALALAALLGGCLHDPTEIVVVVDSDLQPGEFDAIQFVLFGRGQIGGQIAESNAVPATLGIVPSEFGVQQFDIAAVARNSYDGLGNPNIVVQRRVSHIRFVPHEMRAVFISLLRQCMCRGTNCDINPPCNDVDPPTLLEFDADHLPHL
jgi:hypothetical protein